MQMKKKLKKDIEVFFNRASKLGISTIRSRVILNCAFDNDNYTMLEDLEVNIVHMKNDINLLYRCASKWQLNNIISLAETSIKNADAILKSIEIFKNK